MKAGLEIDAVEGHPVGRDPREMTSEELESLGHQAKPMLSIIRAKCLDCVGDQLAEVRRCVSVTCSLWPYRMNSNPMREKKEMTQQQKDELLGRMKRK